MKKNLGIIGTVNSGKSSKLKELLDILMQEKGKDIYILEPKYCEFNNVEGENVKLVTKDIEELVATIKDREKSIVLVDELDYYKGKDDNYIYLMSNFNVLYTSHEPLIEPFVSLPFEGINKNILEIVK